MLNIHIMLHCCGFVITSVQILAEEGILIALIKLNTSQDNILNKF